MAVEESLSPIRRLWIGAFTVAMAGVGFVAGRVLLHPAESVLQPVAFNHRLHVDDVGLECLDCHEYYETGAHSGLPAAETCLGCHEGGVTESPEERKLLEMVARGEEIRFRKLFRLPDHVYYSHRMHVTVAGLECVECHGDVAKTTTPPLLPLVRITMDRCMDCHAERKVRTDCTDCHR